MLIFEILTHLKFLNVYEPAIQQHRDFKKFWIKSQWENIVFLKEI